MANKYGPWATLIDVGGNPQLSAFWKRRLKMLVPASRTSPVLSRRNLSFLVAAGILACLLPTVFFTPAAAQEKKPAEENDTSTKSNIYITTNSGAESGDHIYIPVYISFNLSSEANRKRLNITNEQETKLSEISDNYDKLIKSIRNEMKKSALKEQAAKQREYQAKLEDARKAIRKQIEEFLSPEQLAAMRKEVLGVQAGVIIAYTRLQERIGLTDEQKKQLSALLNSAEQKAIADRFERLVEDNSKKMLAVITPLQWDELQRIAGESSEGYYAFAVSGMSAWSFPGTEIEELRYPETIRKLKISAQQQAKIKDIIAQSERQSAELGQLATQSQSPAPTARQRAQQAEMSQKEQEFRKHNHQQIVEMLTPQQMLELRKICVQGAFLCSIAMPGIQGQVIDGKDPEGILNRLKASQEQIAQLQSLEDEIRSLQRRNFSTLGEQVLAILTTKQQGDVFDVLDDPNKYEDSGKTKSSANNGGGNGAAKSTSGTITIGSGTLVVGDAGNAAKPADAKPGDDKSQAEAKSGSGTAGGSFSGGTLIIGNAADKGKATKAGGPALNGPISLGGEGWPFPSHPNDLDFPFYQPLLNDRTRKELNLSAEQEQKLKEINRSYRAEYLPKEKELIRKTDQETAKSPPEEQDRKLGEMWLTIRKQARPVRKQIEEVFSAEQLAKLRMLVLYDHEPLALLYDTHDPQWYNRLSKAEKDELENIGQIGQKDLMEIVAKVRQAERENDEKTIAVLTPQQRADIERQINTGDFGKPAIFGWQLHFHSDSQDGIHHMEYPVLWEVKDELKLSNEQSKKIYEIFVKSQPSHDLYELYAKNVTSLSKPPQGKDASGYYATIAVGTLTLRSEAENEYTTSPEDPFSASKASFKDTEQPEFKQKVEELKKQLRREIDGVLTPEQSATLDKLLLQKTVARLAKDDQVLNDIHATQQQKDEIDRLWEEGTEIRQQLWHKIKEKRVDSFSPQQRQKCMEELDRREWPGF
jgi:hypothetical protein